MTEDEDSKCSVIIENGRASGTSLDIGSAGLSFGGNDGCDIERSSMSQYDAQEAAHTRSIARLRVLLGRLDRAKCWSDQTTCGIRTTKWAHLSPADIDMAKDFIRDYIAAPQR